MSLIRVITQAGPGGVITTVLTYVTANYWFSDFARNELVLAAAVVGFVFVLVLELLSKPAIAFLSFPIIIQAKRKVDERNNQGHFYYDNEQKKDEFDKYDDQVFRYSCLFYSGVLVAIVSIAHAYLLSGLRWTFGLVAFAIVSIIVLCVLPVIKIKKTIRMTPVMFE